MAIERTDRSIILTGETAKSFNSKMRNMDPSIASKRDKFIQDSKEKVKVCKSKGKITLTIK